MFLSSQFNTCRRLLGRRAVHNTVWASVAVQAISMFIEGEVPQPYGLGEQLSHRD